MHSVTIRLNDGQYALLQARAIAAGVSVTAYTKEVVVGMEEMEPESVANGAPCLRAARHIAGVNCPVCGAS